jgi:hypothetical protein
MRDEHRSSNKQKDDWRLLDLTIRPSDEQLWALDRLMQRGKLRGAEAIWAEAILAKYPPEADVN